MVEFKFSEPPRGKAEDLSSECQRQLQPIVSEIVQAAAAAGWNQKDVLLAMVDVAWDLYEKGRGET
ncbi:MULTISPECIES: hypothetical protein [Rhizobium]|uniref:Uncharacterized protein n=1 Tax=Rhizobium tropici TaxID=398 RepID=A0A6P1C603_RHITR|nr:MULTISPECIES: hypothetical protein [Rhizobium]AGB74170.1 hypothetical protein RTCIAT899_PC01835 [Rhizobium tropici CIAT 899]MBB4240655.1 hypothetical protein [Rhizobium tropici]MBB5591928.1 hypothetical protein [Rhizobium tropici]MBB6490982.1 hypothetical protein [Rhizobium tropici]NEV12639.1 hypothetical protein [Rhizobium tropici]